ncbi:hypothetical protein Tsp_00450 [Trichinella spiralis]|uniref:hypothetical protein n=1 Tax=Trichinella spiralis TaxID=6334 RepID=UPI0001EFB6A4|nr:hypothetical protein Tsp_00450 [Trichinella spiralis]
MQALHDILRFCVDIRRLCSRHFDGFYRFITDICNIYDFGHSVADKGMFKCVVDAHLNDEVQHQHGVSVGLSYTAKIFYSCIHAIHASFAQIIAIYDVWSFVTPHWSSILNFAWHERSRRTALRKHAGTSRRYAKIVPTDVIPCSRKRCTVEYDVK